MGHTSTWALLSNGTRHTVILDPTGQLHPEANQFFLGMALAGRAFNTTSVYGRAVARLLDWCEREGVDWRQVSLANLGRFRRDFELAPRAHTGRPPSPSLVSQTMAGVTSFLRFCAAERLIGSWVAEPLVEPRMIGTALDRTDPTANIPARRIRVHVPETPLVFPPPEKMDLLLEIKQKPRQKFLCHLLWCTAMRIGEALSAWREDVHTLPNNTHLGCPVPGAHIHVGRRYDQQRNRAKTGPRVLPLDRPTIAAYDAYLDWRAEHGLDGKYLLVVSQGETANQPLTYATVLESFQKTIAKKIDYPLTPHMLRHARATWWVRHDVDIDVVRELLGHANIETTRRYLHSGVEDLRAAVEDAA